MITKEYKFSLVTRQVNKTPEGHDYKLIVSLEDYSEDEINYTNEADIQFVVNKLDNAVMFKKSDAFMINTTQKQAEQESKLWKVILVDFEPDLLGLARYIFIKLNEETTVKRITIWEGSNRYIKYDGE